MAHRLDALIEWLLEEIVLSGKNGVSVAQLFAHIDTFYRDANQRTTDGPRQGANIEDEVHLTIDDTFKTEVWNYFTKHPHVLIGADGIGNHLTLIEIEALPVVAVDEASNSNEPPLSPQSLPQSGHEATKVVPEGDDPLSSSPQLYGHSQPRYVQSTIIPFGGIYLDSASEKEQNAMANDGKLQVDSILDESIHDPFQLNDKHAKTRSITLIQQPRIYASEDRTWHILTGHGVDFKKVPRLEWDCLREIATSRANGFVQAELAKATGQDKHAIGRRTDKLEKRGYIKKREIIIRTLPKTYLLTLVKFASSLANSRFATHPDPLELPASVLIRDLEPVPGHERWTSSIIDIEHFARMIVSLVRAWSSILYSNLRKKMSIHEQRWQRKALQTTVRELRAMGVLQKVNDILPENSPDTPKVFIKFLREPTSAEWHTFQRSPGEWSTERKNIAKPNGSRQADSDDDTSSDDVRTSHITKGTNTSRVTAEDGDKVAETSPTEARIGESALVTTEAVIRQNKTPERLLEGANGDSMTLMQEVHQTAPPRRRGRPPKAKGIPPTSASQVESLHGTASSGALLELQTSSPDELSFEPLLKAMITPLPRRRGRPPKPKLTTAIASPAGLATSSPTPTLQETPTSLSVEIQDNFAPEPMVESTSPATTRRRGLPRKMKASTSNHVSSTLVPQRTTSINLPHESDLEDASKLARIYRKTMDIHEVVFTSHDQLQRAAGNPGIYFDIPNVIPDKLRLKGRPKKQMIALFKSEKLKGLPWMQGEIENPIIPSNALQTASKPQTPMVNGVNETVPRNEADLTKKRKSNVEPQAVIDEPGPKRILLDAAYNLGRKSLATYQSPYQSLSYISPYAPNPSSVAPSVFQYRSFQQTMANPLPEMRYVSPYARETNSSAVSLLHTTVSLEKAATSIAAKEPQAATLTLSKPLSTWDLQDQRLEDSIRNLAKSEHPEVSLQIPSMSNGVVGNLCLFADKKTLCFITEKQQPESLFLTLKICDINEPPQISPFDSKSPELRILTKNKDDTEAIHFFRFASTEDAFQAANNMRAKIATAIALLEFQTDNDSSPLEDPRKPFRCEECGGFWKNAEGLKYHRTRSQTSCNPNSDQVVKQRRGRRPKLPSNIEDSSIVVDETNLEGMTQSENNTPMQNIKKANLDPVIDDIAGVVPLESNTLSIDPSVEAVLLNQSPIRPPQIDFAKKISSSEESEYDAHNRKGVIMTLVNTSGGAFPGEKSLWFSFVTAWLQEYPDFGLPYYKACNAAVELLADTGRIRKVLFSFRDKMGLMVFKTVITSRDVDPASPVVTETKEKIKAAYPEHYIPAEFAPPKVVQLMLEERERRQDSERTPGASSSSSVVVRGHISGLEQETKDLGTPSTVSLDTVPGKTTRSGRLLRTPKKTQVVQGNFEMPSGGDASVQDIWEAIATEDDESYNEEHPRNNKTPRKSALVPGNLTKHGRHNQNRSKRLIQQLEASRVARSNNIDDEPNQETDSDVPKRIRRRKPVTDSIVISENMTEQVAIPDAPQQTRQRKQKPEAAARPMDDELEPTTDSDFSGQPKRRKLASCPVVFPDLLPEQWQPALTYFQNKTGAWAESYDRPAQVTSQRPTIKFYHKTRLPEPVTFMQTLTNPAWKFRPYGHGVRPVYSRPSRRTANNPSGNAYLARLHNGFRPIIMPTTRKYGPALPSKNKLHLLLATGNDEVQLLPGAKGKKRGRRDSIMSETQLDNADRPPKKLHRPRKQSYTLEDVDSSMLDAEQATREVSVLLESGLTPSQSMRTRAAHRLPSMTISPNILRPDFVTPPLTEDALINNNDPAPLHSHESELDEFRVSEEDAYSSERLSDDDVVFDEEDKAPVKSRHGRYRESPRAIWQEAQRSSFHVTQSMFTTRRLTALPVDIEGIMTPKTDDPDLAVEVAFEHQRNQPRKRAKEGSMTRDVENRLMVAVIVIRTLTGGLDKQVDWVLVSKLFPEFPMNYIQKQWATIVPKHIMTIEMIGTKFQEWFIEAYEREEVPIIDYDHLLDYDWEQVVNMAAEHIDINVRKEGPSLPSSRSRFNQIFSMDIVEDRRPWRDEYFGMQQPLYKRMENASSEQYTISVAKQPTDQLGMTDLTLAKSWARASILTPAGVYDQNFATQKLMTLGNDIIKAATSALMASKVLMQKNKGRIAPGRGFEITDTFSTALRKHLDETQLSQAAIYKSVLDERFLANETVFVQWTANDGDTLAVTNLQANGRIKLVPQSMPMNKFGLTDGDYQTKRMDKARLRFDIQILPTETYVYDSDLTLLSKIMDSFEPPRSVDGAIPLWYDIAGNIMPAMWKKVLCAVFGTIAMRPGMLVKEMVRFFSPALEEWEVRLLLNWAVKVGALDPLMGGIEGWNVAEWWWLIGGRA